MDKEELTTTEEEDKGPLLDRNLYRTIKKMDRSTLEGLINDIFEQGRQKGLKEAGVMEIDEADDHTLDLRELEKSIRTIPGIGAKRTEAVMQIIEQWLKI